jgi:hypothetical protein
MSPAVVGPVKCRLNILTLMTPQTSVPIKNLVLAHISLIITVYGIPSSNDYKIHGVGRIVWAVFGICGIRRFVVEISSGNISLFSIDTIFGLVGRMPSCVRWTPIN